MNPNFPTLSTAEVKLIEESLQLAVSVLLNDGATDRAMRLMDLTGEIFHGEDPAPSPEPRKRLGAHVGRVS